MFNNIFWLLEEQKQMILFPFCKWKKNWILQSLILTSHLLSVLSLDYLLQNGKVWVCLMNMIPDTQRHSMHTSGIAKWTNTSRESLGRKNWANKLLVRIFFKVHWFIITIKLYANYYYEPFFENINSYHACVYICVCMCIIWLILHVYIKYITYTCIHKVYYVNSCKKTNMLT